MKIAIPENKISDNKYNESGNSATATKKPSMANAYEIVVSMGGITFEAGYGDKITLEEKSDYLNCSFTVRILTIRCHQTKYYKLQSPEAQQTMKSHFFVTDVTINALEEDKNQKLPLSPGTYLASQINQPDVLDYEQLIKDDSNVQLADVNQFVTLQFHLFKENEMKLQKGPFINKCFKNINTAAFMRYIFNKIHTDTGMKIVASKFEPKPLGEVFMLPNTTVIDCIKLIDSEVGFFKSHYMFYCEHDVVWFLNTENDTTVKLPEPDYKLDVVIGRDSSSEVGTIISTSDDGKYFECQTNALNVTKTQDASSMFVESVQYITPSGKTYTNDPGLSRKSRVVRKLTETEPIMKSTSFVYEIVDIFIPSVGFNFFTPMTMINLFDGMNRPVSYRVMSKEITITSLGATASIIKGFRVIDRPYQQSGGESNTPSTQSNNNVSMPKDGTKVANT